MSPIDVWLKFVSWDAGQREDDRQRFVDQQRTLPDGDLIEDERGVRYRLESNDEQAAVRWANTLRNGFCQEAGIDPDRVQVSLEPPEYQPGSDPPDDRQS